VAKQEQGVCVHRLTGDEVSYCYLRTNRIVDPSYDLHSLVFHGKDECWPIRCDAALASACPYLAEGRKTKEAARPLLPCPACGRRHREGSTEGGLCLSWHEVKGILKRMKRDLPEGNRYFAEGTSQLPYDARTPDLVRYLLWPRIKAAVLRRDRCTCQDCGVAFERARRKAFDGSMRHGKGGWRWEYLEVHHIVPRSRGGSDHPGNLKTLCPSCHRRYTNDLMADLLQEGRHEREVVRALAAYQPGEDEQEYPWDIGGD
jgi:cytochrome c553